ncbi:hypothetical protein BDC45DRAFT_534005 [Circinella umbellata]|nr:hypothetical protein BDC45DRAFT_534005 [Circinella umbellata]
MYDILNVVDITVKICCKISQFLLMSFAHIRNSLKAAIVKERHPNEKKLKPTKEENFNCPACSLYFETIQELGTHIDLHSRKQNSAQSSENSEESGSENSEVSGSEESDSEANMNQENIVTLSNSMSIPKSQQIPVVIKTNKCTFDETLLHACQ